MGGFQNLRGISESLKARTFKARLQSASGQGCTVYDCGTLCAVLHAELRALHLIGRFGLTDAQVLPYHCCWHSRGPSRRECRMMRRSHAKLQIVAGYYVVIGRSRFVDTLFTSLLVMVRDGFLSFELCTFFGRSDVENVTLWLSAWEWQMLQPRSQWQYLFKMLACHSSFRFQSTRMLRCCMQNPLVPLWFKIHHKLSKKKWCWLHSKYWNGRWLELARRHLERTTRPHFVLYIILLTETCS